MTPNEFGTYIVKSGDLNHLELTTPPQLLTVRGATITLPSHTREFPLLTGKKDGHAKQISQS